MTVCVVGLWHLGTVTAACLASRGIQTIGLAETAEAAASLRGGKAPLFEPGLEDLLAEGLASGTLDFTESKEAVSSADLVWISYDTPVDDDDVADIEYVAERVRGLFPFLKDGATVLISSQLPVGSTARLEREFAAVAGARRVSFACSPENLRLGGALRAFLEAERIVIGIRDEVARRTIEPVLSKFCERLVWMRVESAEMVKHSLNCYLATCVTFTNEIATLCEGVGADMREVETALRLDPRIGQKAYVRAGAAFGGGTLARDVRFLRSIAKAQDAEIPLVGAILESNARHKGWALRRLRARLGSLQGKHIGLLGLAYKAGTDSIRRSVAVEVAKVIASEGARIVAFDPKVSRLSEAAGSSITVSSSPSQVFAGSDAVLLATEWPEFRALDFRSLVATMRQKIMIDENSFIAAQVSDLPGLEHIIVGRG